MKKAILGSSLILLFIGITSLAPAIKAKYSSVEGKVSVTFPAEITTSDEEGDSYKTVKTQAMLDDVLFFVAYTIHETEISDNESLAKVSMDAFIGGLGATVTKESSWMVNKQNGLQATLTVPASELKGEYRVVLIGQIQYQITAVGSKDTWDQKVVDKFMKSFKVKK